MTPPKAKTSPLEAAAGVAGSRAIEAFSVLGNETRLSILLALWEAYEPWAEDNAVPFTELRERLGGPDSGLFNYHLNKLEGHFVRKTDGGYELRNAGNRIVRTVIAGAGTEDPVIGPTEIDWNCPVCGAPTAIVYRDEGLTHVCTECDGRFGHRGRSSEGTLARVDLDSAGLTDRQPDELINAAFVRATWNTQSAIEGVCDGCSGPMDGWLHRCEDHASEGICPACGRRYAVMARFRCRVCKNNHELVPTCSWFVTHHPAVVSFYNDRGVPVQYESDDSGSVQPRYRETALEEEPGFELVAEDPPRVRVTFEHGGDELQLTIDEDLNVVEVRERP